MIRTEKRWTTQDFEDQIKNFKINKMQVRKTKRANTQFFEDDSIQLEGDSEDEAEFNQKRVGDAEKKVIQDVFGGNVRLMLMNRKKI